MSGMRWRISVKMKSNKRMRLKRVGVQEKDCTYCKGGKQVHSDITCKSKQVTPQNLLAIVK